MKEVLDLLKKREAVLQKGITKAKRELKGAPEGRLRISKKRYYRVTKETGQIGTYLDRENKDIAKALAQKAYSERFIKVASKELAEIESALKLISSQQAEDVFRELAPERKKLVSSHIMTDEEFALHWENMERKRNPYMVEGKIYPTRKGDMVRSKSEEILADMLYELGIPYVYEAELNLAGGVTRYPDFTMLNVGEREEVYLEHLGLLDDQMYLRKNLSKLSEYMRNGIYPGKKLIVTFESQFIPFDARSVRKMIKDYFSLPNEA